MPRNWLVRKQCRLALDEIHHVELGTPSHVFSELSGVALQRVGKPAHGAGGVGIDGYGEPAGGSSGRGRGHAGAQRLQTGTDRSKVFPHLRIAPERLIQLGLEPLDRTGQRGLAILSTGIRSGLAPPAGELSTERLQAADGQDAGQRDCGCGFDSGHQHGEDGSSGQGNSRGRRKTRGGRRFFHESQARSNCRGDQSRRDARRCGFRELARGQDKRRGRQAAANQPAAQALTSPCQSREDRPLGTPHPNGRRLGRESFEVAEDYRLAESSREPADLLVQFGPEFSRFRRAAGPDFRCPPFERPPADQIGPESFRDPPRHSHEPAGQGVLPSDRSGPGGQHEERRLEGVLGVVVVTQNVAADIEHHGTMSCHQGLKRRLGVRAAAGRKRARSCASDRFPATPKCARVFSPINTPAPADRSTICQDSWALYLYSATDPRADSSFFQESFE